MVDDFVAPKLLKLLNNLNTNGFTFRESKTFEETLCLGEKEYVLIRFISSNSIFYRKTAKFCFVLTTGKGNRSRYNSAILLKSSTPRHDEIFIDNESDGPIFNKDLAKQKAVEDFNNVFCHLENAYTHPNKDGKDGKQYFSSGSKTPVKQVVKTHEGVLKTLTMVFGELYDPCPIAPSKDAMVHPWGAMNFVNPPFKHMGAFMLRAAEMAISPAQSKTILIGPANTYTNSFHALAKTKTLHGVAMVRPGKFFDGYKTMCPFPIFLLFIGPIREETMARIPLFFVELFASQKRILSSTTATSLTELKNVIGW